MVSTCVLLLNAGHEATVNTTANGWWTLLRHPEQLAALRSGEVALSTAVEELLRYDTPLQMFERWVLDDIEIGEVTVPRGSEVALLFGSAHRDPARFPDPDRLDLGRADNPHLAFGAGIHYCLGAPLARMELTASFGELLRRAPALRLAREPQWQRRLRDPRTEGAGRHHVSRYAASRRDAGTRPASRPPRAAVPWAVTAWVVAPRAVTT